MRKHILFLTLITGIALCTSYSAKCQYAQPDQKLGVIKDINQTSSRRVIADNAQKRDKERFRISTELGYSYRLAAIPEGLDAVVEDYIRDLKSGLHWGINAHYFTKQYLGFGLNYSVFSSSNASIEIGTTFEDETVEIGVQDKVAIHFIGPSIVSRLRSANKKHVLVNGLSVGYMRYSNEQQAGQQNFKVKGGTLGAEARAEYDYMLSEWFSIGAGFSLNLGSLRTLEISQNGEPAVEVDLEDTFEDRESLTRVQLVAGVRVYL